MEREDVGRIVIGALGIVLVIFLLTSCISLITPREITLVVEKMSWNYSLRIEKEILCAESDWSLPAGSTLIETKRERYKKRYDSDGDFIGWQYKTKYYYEIMRWKYSRDVVTTGENKTPYYGEPNLAENERVDSQTPLHYVHGVNEEGEEVAYILDYESWNAVGLGDTLKLEVSLLNMHATILEYEKSIEKFN